MGYIDPWQIPTPMRDLKPKKVLKDRDGTPASEGLPEAEPQICYRRAKPRQPQRGHLPRLIARRCSASADLALTSLSHPTSQTVTHQR